MLIVFETIADILSKEWSLHGRVILLAGAVFFYLIASIPWFYALKYGAGLSRGVNVFAVISTILALIIGILFYKEQFTRLQIAGMILGFVSLLLIFWEDIL